MMNKTNILNKLNSFSKKNENKEFFDTATKKNYFKPYVYNFNHNIKSITEKFIYESQTISQPNVLRLDLKSLVMDNLHAKFQLTRFDEKIIVEILYPNVKNEITIKISTLSDFNKIFTVNLEDDAFTKNFGAYILKEIDSLIKDEKKKSNFIINRKNDEINKIGDTSPIWESKWNDVFNLVEADNNFFDESDFSLNQNNKNNIDTDKPEISFGDVNSDKTYTFSGSKEEESMKFREKTDWSLSAIDAMQKLIADAIAKQMQSGNGVILSADEILKGTIGIENDSNFQIIDKFLKIYPELDGVDIPISWLDQIEDKLSKNDGQFDAFLQQNLPKIIGKDVVDDTLNNELFDDFTPMGVEKIEKPIEKKEFNEFLSDTNKKFKENENDIINKNDEKNVNDNKSETTINNIVFDKNKILKNILSDVKYDIYPNISKKE